MQKIGQRVKNHLPRLAVLIYVCSAFHTQASQIADDFCKSIHDLPLRDLQKTNKLIQSVPTLRTSTGAADNGRSVEDIERIIAPYNLSNGLKQVFIDNAENSDRDYDVYRTPDGSIFNFSTIEGSEKCPVNVWALNNGRKLEKIDSVPDLGDSCDVVRIYGAYQGFPILVQYSYAPSSGTNIKLARKKIDEIRVLRIVKDKFDDVCVIKPK